MLRVKDSLPIPELASLHKDQPLVQLVVNHFTENPLKKKKKIAHQIQLFICLCGIHISNLLI